MSQKIVVNMFQRSQWVLHWLIKTDEHNFYREHNPECQWAGIFPKGVAEV